MKKIFHLSVITTLLLAMIVSCQDKVEITDLKLDKTDFLLAAGGTATLKANFVPLSASGKMNWTTSNSSVVTVVSDNSTGVLSEGLVTAKAEGTATITVSTKDGKHTATCTVTVINAEPELVSVAGGTFTMGCFDGECWDDELPQHQVTLSGFQIAKHQVTQRQWEAVMGSNPSYIKGEYFPVFAITWRNAQEFITKLNEITGKNYRLPTEAEWEYAARGGNKSQEFKYSGSNNVDEVAWHSMNSINTPHPVGSKKANELGIYDMSGNMWEWCNDWYGPYTDAPQTNPPGHNTGDYRIVRGGSYANPIGAQRVTVRGAAQPNWAGYIGLRLAHP